jgi:hypothetical protein
MLAQERQGVVRGIVLDPHDAVVVGARVEVIAGEHRCATASNGRGEFRCELPPGKYSILASDFSIRPYRRATFNLEVSKEVFVKLRTVPGSAIALTVGPDGVRDVLLDPVGPVRYEESAIDGFDVLVRYGASESQDSVITFHGPYLMLSTGALAVYADHISCSEPIRTCTATGSVRAELGIEELHD